MYNIVKLPHLVKILRMSVFLREQQSLVIGRLRKEKAEAKKQVLDMIQRWM